MPGSGERSGQRQRQRGQRSTPRATWREWLGCGGCLAVVAGLIGGAVLFLNSLGDDAGYPAGGAAPASSSYSPSTDARSSGTPSASASSPDPYDSGTCLNGTLPDSTTAEAVSDVDKVPCSASDAHYKVIETIPMTSDMSRCDSVPRTEYAFSSQYTYHGATLSEYVYCLVGLGSYARR